MVQSTDDADDLSDSFVRAAKLHTDGGLELCAGFAITRLLSWTTGSVQSNSTHTRYVDG
jgi:hypothetical protein